jgi:hypothetical protein
VSSNARGACASRLGEFPQKTHAGSDSSESRPSCVWRPFHPSSVVFERRGSFLSTTLASRRGQGPVGVDAHQYGGTHE